MYSFDSYENLYAPKKQFVRSNIKLLSISCFYSISERLNQQSSFNGKNEGTIKCTPLLRV